MYDSIDICKGFFALSLKTLGGMWPYAGLREVVREVGKMPREGASSRRVVRHRAGILRGGRRTGLLALQRPVTPKPAPAGANLELQGRGSERSSP